MAPMMKAWLNFLLKSAYMFGLLVCYAIALYATKMIFNNHWLAVTAVQIIFFIPARLIYKSPGGQAALLFWVLLALTAVLWATLK